MGKNIKLKNGRAERSNFCSRKCYAIWKSPHSKGDLNNNWKGGLSNEPYPFEFNKELKELIHYRDGQCQRCGCPEVENGRKLDIHHIDYNKQNLNPDNLISLCRSCNLIVNFNREKWEIYFNKKIKKVMNSNIMQLNFNREEKTVIKNV